MTEQAKSKYDHEYFFCLAAEQFLSTTIDSSEEFTEENEDLVLWEPFEHYPVADVAVFTNDMADTLQDVHENAMKYARELIEAEYELVPRLSDEQAEKYGEQIAEVFHMRVDHDHPDRYKTWWGTKTPVGVYRTALRLVKELIVVNKGENQ